ncbi:FecR family protein [Chitinophaga filiformis]|uniref:Ferric-dicitrate binding protein FerR, regulates iron transport through sigma-19 n=1 Tax=Chitinophaga filiformis TaxID=104663 RepID=A0A1G7TT23_CHIFI|nr:FecR domain-containing protein [Chitinophaga filiformis]SDG38154.1 ferric-dicitrate binding protein FerR, regulates iron transport through sigma-19 [Chitinophaga filiformis]
MSKQQNIAITEALLIKYLAGEASPEEALAIDEWVEQTPDNNRLLQQYLQLWSHAGKEGAYTAPDLQRELQRLNIDTSLPTGSRKTPVLRTLFIRRAVAVVFMVALGAALLVFFQPWKTAKAPLMLALTSSNDILRDTLPDHSRVTLAPGSRLEHPASFDGADRTVQLQGEGYFSIAPNASKPFIVRTGTADIKVIGTAFNVKTNKDSVTIAMDNGAVLFFDNHDSVIVKGGMQSVYQVDTHRFSVTKMEGGNDYAYATKTFHFEATRLELVVSALEKAYNVKIVLENKKLADCTITTSFTDMPIQYVMEVITASLSLQYHMEGSTIYVQGNECN